jgi:MFS family permease
LPVSATTDAARLVATRAVRAFGDGLVGVVLPTYLAVLGFSTTRIGVVTTVTLLGSAAATLAVGFGAIRASSRTLLIGASGLMLATGAGFVAIRAFAPLLIVAFVGTLNPSGGDVSVFLPLEQALLPEGVAAHDRTALFARYSLTASLMAAAGASFAGVPGAIERATSLSPRACYAGVFVLYAALGAIAAPVYRSLTVGRRPVTRLDARLGPSRKTVLRLAALFSLDSFGGGFVAQSLLVVWLHHRFSLGVGAAGALFAVTSLLAAFSALGAERIARRIGLIRTMAYTHLPANMLLIAAALSPNLGFAIGALIARSLLSQMDVPARTSYVMAVVTPAERTAAASITNVPRSLTAALSPALAGIMLEHSSFGWPLIIAGALKGAYDIALLFSFRNLRPPEEQDAPHKGLRKTIK